ncbi:hypothetical protein [Pseudomonas sp. Marseille-Q7302]
MAKDNPVWAVYDQLRTCRLNELYYGHRLAKYERINFWAEIIVAAASASSAVAGLALWNTGPGKYLWQILLILAAAISLAKPILNLTKKIRAYEEVLMGYRMMVYDYRDLRMDISQSQKYSTAHQARFKKLQQRMREICGKSPERVSKASLKKTCHSAVLEEFPDDQFFLPGENHGQ